MSFEILGAIFNAFIPTGLQTYAEIAIVLAAGTEIYTVAKGFVWNK